MVKASENLGDIIFYCKDCEEIVETLRVGGKYVYKCKKCGTKNVAFGTRKSIYGFFRLEDEKEEAEEVAEKAEEKALVKAVGEKEIAGSGAEKVVEKAPAK